jgi:hypothetical protein
MCNRLGYRPRHMTGVAHHHGPHHPTCHGGIGRVALA